MTKDLKMQYLFDSYVNQAVQIIETLNEISSTDPTKNLRQKIYRNAKELKELARSGYNCLQDYLNETIDQDEYNLMLETCDRYFKIIDETMKIYIRHLSNEQIKHWYSKEINYHKQQIVDLTCQLDVAKYMQGQCETRWNCWLIIRNGIADRPKIVLD